MVSTWEQQELTLLALGRLDATLAHAPLLAAWWHRAQLEATVRLTALEGERIDAARLLALIAGIAPGRRDAGLEARAIRLYRLMARAAGAPSGNDAAAEVDQSGELSGELEAAIGFIGGASRDHGSLWGLVEALWRWLDEGGGGPAGHAALARALAARGLVGAPYPCLTGRPAREVALSDKTSWIAAVLLGLRNEASGGAMRALDLQLAWRGWRRALAGVHADSQVHRLLDLAAALPVLTPRSVADHLVCSLPGASRSLATLAAKNILVEVSGRGSWRCFVTRDLADARTFSRAAGRTETPIWPEAEPVVLTDRVMRQEERLRAPLRSAERLDPERPKIEATEAALDLAGLMADLDRASRGALQRLEALRGRKPD